MPIFCMMPWKTEDSKNLVLSWQYQIILVFLHLESKSKLYKRATYGKLT